MSFIQNLYTSRDNNANAETYVGQVGRIWWDPVTNAFYASDGNTAGGVPVGISNSANITVNSFTANSGTINGNLVVVGNISPAAVGKIGGITPGPGVVIGNTGILTIDSANLPVSFGNFYANNNILTIVNANENMILSTQGNATIQMVGNIGFYKTDGSSPSGQYFSATDNGIVTVTVTAVGVNGAFNIVGSTTGNEISPGQTGAMLHVTGQLDTPTRVYFDGNGDYVSLVARRWNGNIAVPTQVLAGEDVLRINSTATTDAGVGNVAMAQIRMTALENQTSTAQGSSITFTATPIGSPASARVDVANVTVANGVTATKFTTSGTVVATSNISGGNLLTTGAVSATGNVAGNYFVGNGSVLTNLTGANVTGTVANATYALNANASTYAGTVTTNAQPNITSVGTLTSLTSGTHTISANANIAMSGSLSQIAGGNLVSASYLTGTLTTAAQTNITSVGTLGSLSVTGNATVGNISATNHTCTTVNVTGNVTGGNLLATNNLVVTGNIRYDQASNNATVTQLTSKATPVTCNGRTGQITTSNSQIAKGAAVSFTVNNTFITSAKDVVILSLASGASVNYALSVNAVNAAGSFVIAINNADSTGSGANASDTLVINFAIIKVS